MPALVPAPRSATCAADPALLGRLAAGDDATWRQVVRQYEGLLRGSARAVLRNDADVDEAVQRTWILLLNNADRINDVDRLPGWLATTVRREALAVVRSQQRNIPSEDIGDRAGIDDLDIATDLLRAELEEALHEAVKALPPTQQSLVRALLREPASYDDLSRELGIPRGSLGPLRGRAVRTLRSRLEPSFA
jgi:RNA polymerase sigma factor (sigma-70 family)